MTSTKPTGPTRVAVAIPRCGDKMLLIYNEKWRAFTFPMTKLRAWEFVDVTQVGDPDRRALVAEKQQSCWLDAAAHALVECLGQPNSPQPLVDGPIAVEFSEVEASLRDGADRIYHYRVFTLDVAQEFESWEQPYAWLTSEEIRSGKLRPMSPTVLEILGRQEVSAILKEWQ